MLRKINQLKMFVHIQIIWESANKEDVLQSPMRFVWGKFVFITDQNAISLKNLLFSPVPWANNFYFSKRPQFLSKHFSYRIY
jgi:hypothetical protein